jgi:hypothetical protein
VRKLLVFTSCRLMVSVTLFTIKSYFSIPGYSFCHTNHPDGKAHGSTAILVRSTITYSEQLQYAKPELQPTNIQVKGQLRSVNIASVYCPPKYNLNAPQFNAFFQTLGPCFVAGCDYNCKHTLWQRFPNCGPRTTGGPRVLPLWSS